jgi:bifunctional ADP-heptose synthase (sugar kinase/adenylyltransferase)
MSGKSNVVIAAEEAMRIVKENLTKLEARRRSEQHNIALQEDATEEQLQEAWKSDLAEFREAVIVDEYAKGVLQHDGMTMDEIRFEVDRLLTPMHGENAAKFMEDVAMAEILGKPIRRNQMLQWLQEYRPFPRHN